MTAIAAAVAAFVFGAADQYLGSVPGHFGHFAWTADASLLSAPWLLIAFAAGCTQREPGRAVVAGLAATFAALIGYLLMTLSPIEGAQLTVGHVLGFVRSDVPTFAGALITGPLFGWLGHRWRVARSWKVALLTAATLVFEPVAHLVVGRPITSDPVALTEVMVGIGLAVAMVAARRPVEPVMDGPAT